MIRLSRFGMVPVLGDRPTRANHERPTIDTSTNSTPSEATSGVGGPDQPTREDRLRRALVDSPDESRPAGYGPASTSTSQSRNPADSARDGPYTSRPITFLNWNS